MQLIFKNSAHQAGDAQSFTFESNTPTTWRAGQYIHLTLPHDDADDRGDERWFTISAAPSENTIVITTRINADRKSSFKTALLALNPGDTIDADAPEGDFTIDDPTKDYLFIAGGIGITPYRSMLVDAAARDQQLNVTLLYANRTHDIVFKAELDQLQTTNPHLSIDYIIQPDMLNIPLIQQKLATLNDPTIYVSGPEPMVEALTAQLVAAGIEDDHIKGDYFPGYEAD